MHVLIDHVASFHEMDLFFIKCCCFLLRVFLISIRCAAVFVKCVNQHNGMSGVHFANGRFGFIFLVKL